MASARISSCRWPRLPDPYGEICVYPRCTESRHPLHLRPPGQSRAAGDSPAALPAFADAHPVVFAEGRSGAAFRQLAAGSAGQLLGPPGLSGEDARVPHRSRSGGRNVGHQPLRLLPRTACRRNPVYLRGLGASRTQALSLQVAGDAPLPEVPRRHLAREDAQRRLPGRAQRPPAAGHRLHDPTRASRRPRKPSGNVPVHVATRPGCWSRYCAISAWRRVSFPVI